MILFNGLFVFSLTLVKVITLIESEWVHWSKLFPGDLNSFPNLKKNWNISPGCASSSHYTNTGNITYSHWKFVARVLVCKIPGISRPTVPHFSTSPFRYNYLNVVSFRSFFLFYTLKMYIYFKFETKNVLHLGIFLWSLGLEKAQDNLIKFPYWISSKNCDLLHCCFKYSKHFWLIVF